MRQALKLLHEVGTVGCLGALFVLGVLALQPVGPPRDYVVLRQAMLVVDRWVLLPCLLLTVISGLLSLSLFKAFRNSDWAIAKAVMTPLVFEGALLSVDGPARRAAYLARQWAEGDDSARAALDTVLFQEWGGIWIMGGLYLLNVGLAIWRPRFRPRPASEAPSNAPATDTQ